MSDVGDGAQVAAAVFTAAAAGAALRTVRQGQRLWRHGVEPDIHVQVLRNVNTGHTDLAIFNVGGGVARGVFFVLAVDDQKATGTVHDSIMAAGTKFIVQTQLPHGDDSECVVWWRNIDESSWAIDRVGPKRRLRRAKRWRWLRRRVKPRTFDDVWAMFYPDRPISGLTEVDYEVTKSD